MSFRYLCLSPLLVPAISAPTNKAAKPNVVEVLSQKPDFSVFDHLVHSSRRVLEDWTLADPITIFAPNNEAFEYVSASLLHRMAEDANYSAHLEYVLNCHAVADALPTKEFGLHEQVLTKSQEIARLTSAPPAINGAVVLSTAANTKATNGLVQGIDGVILPTSLLQNIIEAISGMPELSIFLSLLKAAPGLYEDLQEDSTSGPLTVFVPTNEAFDGLDLDELKRYEPEHYAYRMKLLEYHVFDGTRIIGGMGDSALIRIAETPLETRGGCLRVDPRNGTINGHATVIQPDILASNGVIHLVDEILISESSRVFDASGGGMPGVSTLLSIWAVVVVTWMLAR